MFKRANRKYLTLFLIAILVSMIPITIFVKPKLDAYFKQDLSLVMRGEVYPDKPEEGLLFYDTFEHNWFWYGPSGWQSLKDKGGGGGGAKDHGALTGLADDDHLQYLLVDGSRGLTGNIDVNQNQLLYQVYHKGTSFPGSPVEGQPFYREDLHVLYVYNGTDWESMESSGGGVTDHGALTGLSDDDHLQYLLTDGSRDLTGDLNLSQNQILYQVYHKGTSFPSSPFEGQPYYRTDLHELYVYNGTDWESLEITGGVEEAQFQPYSWLLTTNTTNVFMQNSAGQLVWSSTDTAAVVNAAYGNVSGTYEELIVCVGDFPEFSDPINPENYSTLELYGKFTFAGGASEGDDFLYASNKHYWTIRYGEWDGNSAGQTVDFTDGLRIYDCSNFVLESFSVHNIKNLIDVGGNGVWIESCWDITVRDLDIYETGGSLQLVLVNSSLITQNRITDNTAGIYLFCFNDATPQTCRDNQITLNHIARTVRDGISVYPAGAEDFCIDNQINFNTLIDCGTDGAHASIANDAPGIMMGNTYHGNKILNTGVQTGAGFTTWPGFINNMVTDNTFTNVYKSAFTTDGYGNVFAGFVVNGCAWSGSHPQVTISGKWNTVKDGYLSDAGNDCIFFDDNAKNNTLKDVTMVRSQNQAIQLATGAESNILAWFFIYDNNGGAEIVDNGLYNIFRFWMQDEDGWFDGLP